MLKKTIKYKNFADEEVEEEFFFHLSKAELVELEVGGEGGSLHDELVAMTKNQDGNKIIKTMKKLLLASYGVKSVDGKRFVKNQQLRDEFESSEAYSVMFMEMLTDAEAASTFVTGVVPPEMAASAAEAINNAKAPEQPVRVVTRDELVAMPTVEYQELRKELDAGRAKLAD